MHCGAHLRRAEPQGTIWEPPKTWGEKVGWQRFQLRQPTPRRSPKWLPNENSIAPQGPSNKASARGPRKGSAYDGASTRNLLRQRYEETLDVVIPPPKDAVIRLQSSRDATVRDRHIAQIRSNGCMAWQTATGYNQRSRIETQMGRWKSVIGPKLKFRSFSRQITEVQLGRKVLNTMTALGRPVFERIS